MSIRIERFGADQLHTHFAEFVDLLCDTVNHGASVNFLAPMSVDLAEEYWHKIAADLPSGTRLLLAALDGDHVVGSVQLALATQPNGLHRAEVQKLFVHTSHRRQGIARLLMTAIDEEARAHNRTLLVLDTEQGSGAETFYVQMGYERAGVIPNYALDTSGKLISTVVFYKSLS